MITFKMLGRYGRLGNQMFQIASSIGIAVKSGQPYGFPAWKNYDHAERFGSGETIEVQEYFTTPLPAIIDDVPYADHFIHWGYHDVHLPVGNWSLSGHMQSEKYFSHCSGLIRQYFTMKQELPVADKCAIHLRLGDYDDNYHPTMKMDYYERAMALFPSTQKYLVFSDDISAARSLFGSSVEYYEGANYMEDFRRMKSCTSFIIANSTFSWWAAWLAGGRTIAPRKWFGEVAGLSSDDLYARNWTVL